MHLIPEMDPCTANSTCQTSLVYVANQAAADPLYACSLGYSMHKHGKLVLLQFDGVDLQAAYNLCHSSTR